MANKLFLKDIYIEKNLVHVGVFLYVELESVNCSSDYIKLPRELSS